MDIETSRIDSVGVINDMRIYWPDKKPRFIKLPCTGRRGTWVSVLLARVLLRELIFEDMACGLDETVRRDGWVLGQVDPGDSGLFNRWLDLLVGEPGGRVYHCHDVNLVSITGPGEPVPVEFGPLEITHLDEG